MADRFFSEVPVTGPQVELTGDQAHHAANVMRLKAGDQVGLFDGSGREFKTSILEISRKRVLLSIDEEIEPPVDTRPAVVIAVAMPKGDRQKFMIEKLVELGASKLIPLKTSRSVAVVKENVVLRLKRQVIEAAKQCGRSRLLEIESAHSIKQLADIAGSTDDLFLLADPYCGKSIADRVSELDSKPATNITVVIAVGPEGGFADDEIETLSNAGFLPFQMGDSVLRIETAAIAATTLVRMANS